MSERSPVDHASHCQTHAAVKELSSRAFVRSHSCRLQDTTSDDRVVDTYM